MIDYPTYQELHPHSVDKGASMLDSKMESTFIEQEAPSEPDIYLLPRTVLGFNLRRKIWGEFSQISQTRVCFADLTKNLRGA